MSKLIFVTGVSGVGKSSVCEYIRGNKLLENYDIYDIDDLENVNEYNNDTYNLFYENAIVKALKKSQGNDIIMASSINPTDIDRIILPKEIEKICMIIITCSNDELYKRLKKRNPERNCGSDLFISNQINYQKWILEHINLYQLHIDNTDSKIAEIANYIMEYVSKLD